MALPYPPPWQDISTLCEHLCISVTTVEVWTKQGILPPPRMRGGKRMWRWAEVDRWLESGGPDMPQSAPSQEEGIRNATRAATRATN
jgi:excisionase family DNA binding protein